MQDKVAIYCRLSNEDNEKAAKGDDSESIQNQKLLLMEHAMKQGWQIHGIYSDDDFSGLDKERPAFNEMLTAAQQGKFNIILCKNQSRFSRDMEMIERYLHNLFILWGIRFIGVVDHVDTGVKGGKKARQISGLVNEWYCEDISENVTAALVAKKKSGQYLGHWCTYGYELNPCDKHKLIVDEPAAEVVREIYRLYLAGYGVAAIANTLTKREMTTPSIYKRTKGKNYRNPAEKNAAYSSKYGVWAVNTIRHILRDETYLGHLIQGREKKLNYKSKKVVKVTRDEWIVVQDNHIAIIDEDTFAKVQQRLGVRAAAFNPHDEPSKTHIFAGKVKCLHCGHTMQKHHGRNGIQYLKCGLALKTKNQECTLHTLRIDLLRNCVEKQIQDIVEAYTSDAQNAKMLMESFMSTDDMSADLQRKTKHLADLTRQQQELSTGLSGVYMDKVRGNLTEAQFRAIRQGIESEIQKSEAAITQLQKAIDKLEDKTRKTKRKLHTIESYIRFQALTQEMVNDFIDFIEVGEKSPADEQPIHIHWLF